MGPVLAVALLLSGCAWTSLLPGGTAAATTSGGGYGIVDTNQTICYGNSSAISTPGKGEAFCGQDAQIDGNQPQYVDNADGTVTDLVTGLMWVKSAGEKVTHEQAVAGAAACSAGGHTDRRLPTLKELYSLIDFAGTDVDPGAASGATPFIDTSVFGFSYGDPSTGERIIDSQWARAPSMRERARSSAGSCSA